MLVHRSNSVTEKQPQRGFTLTELAIVLGVIGLILGAIWVAAGQVSRNNKVASLTQQILAIQSGVRGAYSSRATMTAGNQNNNFINMGVIPSNMVVTGQNDGLGAPMIHDPWGQTVDVASQSGWDGLPAMTNAFEILIGWPTNTMTTAECQSVLRNVVTPSSVANGLIGVGGQGINMTTGTANINNLTDQSFNNCSGHFTLQFTLN